MPTYRVTWDIDIDADDMVAAARKAHAIQHNPDSIATVFHVREHGTSLGSAQTIDLSELEETQ